jgi:wyosine [tRNA(Phe)-imidazoG37] synthetase (radical SAM superfamily)
VAAASLNPCRLSAVRHLPLNIEASFICRAGGGKHEPAMKPNDYRYIFGPVASRRFGRSLGIDLTSHKTCSLNCVFCQLGPTPVKTLARKVYVPTNDVIAEVDRWLESGGDADYLALSGSGEPTLHREFGRVLARLDSAPIPSALLTNGTLLHAAQPGPRRCEKPGGILRIALKR